MPSPQSTDEERVRALLARGRRLHREGDLDGAAACYRGVLDHHADHADALYLFALVLYRRGEIAEATTRLRHAIAADPAHAMAHASLGQVLQDAGRDEKALPLLERAAALRDDNPAVFNALGLSLMRTGNAFAARRAFDRAIELAPNEVEARVNRANLDRFEGRLDDARRGYEQCLALRAGHAEAHNNLGVILHQRQCPADAARHFEAAIATRPDHAEAHNNLGAALNDLGDASRALAAFRRAAALAPDLVEARVNAAVTLMVVGRQEEARRVLDDAAGRAPRDPAIVWSRCMASLEPVYRSEDHAAMSRAAYERRLRALAARLRADGPAAAARCVALAQPFLLPYQGEADRALQSMYGDMLCTGIDPHSQRVATSRRVGGPLRVGIVSAFFFDHSNWKVPISGWLPRLADAFELHGFYTGSREDACTASARAACHRFHAALSVEEMATAIGAEEIDVLIYPEVGMNPSTTRLAARRLAPVQCVSWGHPVTSGLPTLDYFLSSEWMEPADGDAHYRERLVRLPGLSFTCPAPVAEQEPANRFDFGLGPNDVVYLCVQNLSKYLPRHDCLFTDIAQRVGAARFVFIEGTPGATDALRRRLRGVFGESFDRCVVFLPRLPRSRFLSLHDVADAALDTPSWSGCNSSLDALSRCLPVVTLPGRFMRGRHTTAIYRQMGYDALVARDETDYVERAVRLGLDADWRAAQRLAMAECGHKLYDDDTPSRALVEFIRRAARDAGLDREGAPH